MFADESGAGRWAVGVLEASALYTRCVERTQEQGDRGDAMCQLMCGRVCGKSGKVRRWHQIWPNCGRHYL
jgi:hypothetical protein